VTVPGEWDAAVSTNGWRPPRQTARFAAVSAGTSPSWADDAGGQGVFVGMLPGTDLPAQLPQHPECEEAQEPDTGTSDGAESITVRYSGCPGGVVVERVVQLTANRLLWVQVRSADSATANQVLDAVTTHGFS
jgi:hypothetical protein